MQSSSEPFQNWDARFFLYLSFGKCSNKPVCIYYCKRHQGTLLPLDVSFLPSIYCLQNKKQTNKKAMGTSLYPSFAKCSSKILGTGILTPGFQLHVRKMQKQVFLPLRRQVLTISIPHLQMQHKAFCTGIPSSLSSNLHLQNIAAHFSSTGLAACAIYY